MDNKWWFCWLMKKSTRNEIALPKATSPRQKIWQIALPIQ